MQRTTVFGRTKFLSTVGERQVKVIASDGSIDRMGDQLMPWGCELEEYRRNPVVLAQHDNTAPIARCSDIHVENAAVVATIDFPPPGTSERSDEYLRLLKTGVVAAVSVGFLPLDWERIDTGYKYIRWELLELSCVSVPANANALVVERAFRDQRSPPVARCPSRLPYAGSLAQRLRQADYDYQNSAEAAEERWRRAHALRLRGEIW
jgi:HK97 family phage prohead protease